MAIGKVVIYCRYSSDNQRQESCEDQEREIRSALGRMGFDLTDAVVIHDNAESGTKTFRDEFARLELMIKSGEVSDLVVDDQSRLTRAENAYSFIKDLVFSGGRFLSTTEGIDTNVTGWELKVKVLELHNSETIRGLKDKVRRGQRGRVLADDSAGDFGYGYESFHKDSDWQEQLARRGPAPKKGIRICEDQAAWVRKIFEWFLAALSLHKIVAKLVAEDAPKNRRAMATGWSVQQVRRILRNEKYIGIWKWMQTTGISNSSGKKKRIPAQSHDTVTRLRPELRIVDQVTWDLAQARIAKLKLKYANPSGKASKKTGAKRPKNPAAVHPRTLLGGAMICARCGAPMWVATSRKIRHYYCSGRRKGVCPATFVVPAEIAEETVVSKLTGLVADWPDWICEVHKLLLRYLEEQVAEKPGIQEKNQRRLAELRKQIGNFNHAIANGGAASTSIMNSLLSAERDAAELEAKLAAMAEIAVCAMAMPDEVWVKAQLQQWSNRLADSETTAVAIREAVASLTAEAVVPPGKKRGYVRLRLRVNGWNLLMAAINTKLPIPLRALLPKSVDGETSPMIELILGGPTAIDRWMPNIVQWRKEGVTWEEISSRTELGVSNLFIAWKRYGDAYKSE
jgi:DNA invertase Pin-like site-specific DNA recombinase